ncbi:hypothetical protein HC928_12565 [bacterium]|nr:hypothetical protein [bacterium]
MKLFLNKPLLIGADGVSVPFRPQPNSPKGKIVYQEIKVALLVRLGSRLKRSGEQVTHLLHRRIVAVRGNIVTLQGQLQLEAHRQGVESASQVVWISDGARGLWGLFEQCFVTVAVGILDFYHATQHLFEAAQAYGHTLPTRTPDDWFIRLRHQLRHGFVHHIIHEFSALLRYASTPQSAKPTLQASPKLSPDSSSAPPIPHLQKAETPNWLWHGGECLQVADYPAL